MASRERKSRDELIVNLMFWAFILSLLGVV